MEGGEEVPEGGVGQRENAQGVHGMPERDSSWGNQLAHYQAVIVGCCRNVLWGGG